MPDFFQKRIGALAEFAPALGAVLRAKRRHNLQRQHDVLAYRQPWQHGRVLKRHTDPDRFGANLPAGNVDVAARGADQSAHQLEDGGFAAARGADKRDEIALVEA
jgi:hypothetical protein